MNWAVRGLREILNCIFVLREDLEDMEDTTVTVVIIMADMEATGYWAV